MTWVLILNCDIDTKPPTVIGGYATQEEAENAGDLATAFDNSFGGPFDPPMPFYCRYAVIPGAAMSGPASSTLCELDRADDYKIVRQKKRFP